MRRPITIEFDSASLKSFSDGSLRRLVCKALASLVHTKPLQSATRHPGYRASQVIRKMIETLFGEGKQHGGTIRQVNGRNMVSAVFTLAMLAVNLRRWPGLLAARAIMAGSG